MIGRLRRWLTADFLPIDRPERRGVLVPEGLTSFIEDVNLVAGRSILVMCWGRSLVAEAPGSTEISTYCGAMPFLVGMETS